jgi:uncharacterized phosphosugar-binding protein
MSAEKYFELAQKVYDRIRTTQRENIQKAGGFAADSIARGGLVHLFGSGHSVIPVLDVFPRYGSFAGFHPLMDSRLMWTQVLGSGGVRELLQLERTEGYVKPFLSNFKFEPIDTMVVYSHGGLNAAPIEVALHAKSLALKVVAVTSLDNARIAQATHSSGKKLADLGDAVIDNCCPPEDSLVEVACPWRLAPPLPSLPSPWPWWPRRLRNSTRAASSSGPSFHPTSPASGRTTIARCLMSTSRSWRRA